MITVSVTPEVSSRHMFANYGTKSRHVFVNYGTKS